MGWPDTGHHGLFGISEVILNIEEEDRSVRFLHETERAVSDRQDWRESVGPIGRDGDWFPPRVLPGAGPIMASLWLYSGEEDLETSERFGQGEIAGVAAPEAATMPRPQSGSFHADPGDPARPRWPSSSGR